MVETLFIFLAMMLVGVAIIILFLAGLAIGSLLVSVGMLFYIAFQGIGASFKGSLARGAVVFAMVFFLLGIIYNPIELQTNKATVSKSDNKIAHHK